MAIINLEQAGWKRVCPLSESHLADIKRVLNFANYENVESQEFLLCKPLISEDAQPRKLIYISNVLDENNYSEWNKIINSQIYFSKGSGIKHHQTYVSDPENFVKKFEEKEGVESFKALTTLLTVAHPTEILEYLQKFAVPSFFEKYQKGKIYFIRYDDILVTMNSVARVLSDVDIFGVDIFRENLVPRSMRRVHHTGLDTFVDTTLKSILGGFFPNIYGVAISRIGGYILLLFDNPFKFEPDKPEWDYFKESGIFDDIKGKLNFEQLINLVRKKEVDFETAYNRYVHHKDFSVDNMDSLIKWLISCLNDYYLKLLDFCNFSNEANFIDFTFHRKVYLTLERIFLEINNVIFEFDNYLKKILYFDLHDKISNLMVTSSQDRPKIFKRLLRLSHFNGKISKILQNLPVPFNSYLIEYGEGIYNAIIESSVNHIWDKSRKTDKGVQLREIDSENQNKWIGKKYKDTRTKISDEEYSVNLLHEFRNTLHGYVLNNFYFEKYLAIHEGQVSDYLPDLSLIWLFVMLDNINNVLVSELIKTDY